MRMKKTDTIVENRLTIDIQSQIIPGNAICISMVTRLVTRIHP